MRTIEFPSRAAAANSAAKFLAAALREQLKQEARALLIVSGGASPVLCLTELSDEPLDWSRVDVTLTDERLVPGNHDESNEKMVRETLIKGKASAANFIRLTKENLNAFLNCAPISLVGMGEDGHFASIFPDNPDLKALTDPDQLPDIFDITTNASPLPRRTVNLALLSRSKALLLLAYGGAKRATLESPAGLPVQQLLEQSIDVYLAP
jgi:6-phosphogluconolactonase